MGLAGDNFWGHEVARTAELRVLESILLEGDGPTEIADLVTPIFGDENVVWLIVSG